jgi:hypothetical protein
MSNTSNTENNITKKLPIPKAELKDDDTVDDILLSFQTDENDTTKSCEEVKLSNIEAILPLPLHVKNENEENYAYFTAENVALYERFVLEKVLEFTYFNIPVPVKVIHYYIFICLSTFI